MKIDIKERLWFCLSNKEVYFLEENIATKVYEGAEGKNDLLSYSISINFNRLLWQDSLHYQK